MKNIQENENVPHLMTSTIEGEERGIYLQLN